MYLIILPQFQERGNSLFFKLISYLSDIRDGWSFRCRLYRTFQKPLGAVRFSRYNGGRNGELDLLWLWILCGLPFGIHRMCVWIVPGGGSLGGGAALFVLNFIIGGLIGGFVLVWRLLVAAWYVPLTIYRLIVGY